MLRRARAIAEGCATLCPSTSALPPEGGRNLRHALTRVGAWRVGAVGGCTAGGRRGARKDVARDGASRGRAGVM
jgi:hypothetical protein